MKESARGLNLVLPSEDARTLSPLTKLTFATHLIELSNRLFHTFAAVIIRYQLFIHRIVFASTAMQVTSQSHFLRSRDLLIQWEPEDNKSTSHRFRPSQRLDGW